MLCACASPIIRPNSPSWMVCAWYDRSCSRAGLSLRWGTGAPTVTLVRWRVGFTVAFAGRPPGSCANRSWFGRDGALGDGERHDIGDHRLQQRQPGRIRAQPEHGRWRGPGNEAALGFHLQLNPARSIKDRRWVASPVRPTGACAAGTAALPDWSRPPATCRSASRTCGSVWASSMSSRRSMGTRYHSASGWERRRGWPRSRRCPHRRPAARGGRRQPAAAAIPPRPRAVRARTTPPQPCRCRIR